MTWSPSYVAFVQGVTPESIFTATSAEAPKRRREWVHIQTAQRLADQYGLDRAARIMSGEDKATIADVNAWNMLGRRAAA